MEIDVYRNVKNSNEFISVPSGTDVSTLDLPEEVSERFSELELVKSNLKLNPDKPLIAMDPNEIINSIDKKGYAIHAVKIEFKT